MRRSTERILTTHVGSLIRPAPLLQFIGAKQRRQPYDERAYQDCLRNSVSEIVARQAEVGIDTPSDGEFGKSISWSQYALERLSGFERRPVKPGANPFQRGADRERFAEFYGELDAKEGVATTVDSVCVGPIAYTGQARRKRDIGEAMGTEYRMIVEAGFLLQLDDARAATTYDRMVPPASFSDYRNWVE